MSYKEDAIAEIIKDIKRAGFRVFLAEKGTYGFFTDKDGTRIISFQDTGLSHSYSGNYKTDQGQRTGSGWRILEGHTKDIKGLFDSYPPQWAVGDSKWRFTTLKENQDLYQKSSKYQEV